nr:MAG TPA: zinc-ribbon domain protein [Caudoviricetes sp.]
MELINVRTVERSVKKMAYHIEDDTYSCDCCGFRNKWDASDSTHGELWGCEKCGNTFCSKCFIDKFGSKEYMNMMQGSNQIYCPNCWENEREGK